MPEGRTTDGGNDAGSPVGMLDTRPIGPATLEGGDVPAVAPQPASDKPATADARIKARRGRIARTAIATEPGQIWAEQNAYVYW